MKQNNRLFLDIHAIQNLPPSNINRDDTGSPKTAQYGGVRRARVSSQSWKKAMREYFKKHGDEGNIGVRTLYVPAYVASFIKELNPEISEEDALNEATEKLKAGEVKIGKENKTGALFFIGERQARALANLQVPDKYDKEEKQQIVAILKDNPAIDIALFGRMVANDPSLNEDASSQVAHAISTHAVETEYDYFTAIDDNSTLDHAGAGMIGTVEYNSSTLYRYANVAVHEFARQLSNKEDTVRALKLYMEAFIRSLPTGKVNTFANQTLPEGILVSLRSDRPLNFVTAYEDALKSRDGFTKASIERLIEASEKFDKYADPAEYKVFVSLDDFELPEKMNEASSIDDLIEKVASKLDEMISLE